MFSTMTNSALLTEVLPQDHFKISNGTESAICNIDENIYIEIPTNQSNVVLECKHA